MQTADLRETFYPRLVAFLAFGAMGLVEYVLATFVVEIATNLAGLSVAGDTVALAATLVVVGTMVGGGMPPDN